MGSRSTALKGDVLKIDAAELDQLQQRLDQACGAAERAPVWGPGPR